MTDNERNHSRDHHPPSTPPEEPACALAAFEQLTLGSTLTGPGGRSEDHYERGAEVKIKGERGVFKYRYASVSRAGSVSLHLQGPDGSRAVRPDQVVPVRKKRPGR